MIPMSFTDAAERVKASLDIVEVVQRHVVLKKTGRNYLGKCPFHGDKHPSMNVSREKRMFKCFACGEGGDAIGFLMKIQNKTYGELIKDLASDAGIEILREGQNFEQVAKTRDLKQKVMELNAETNHWFQAQLLSDTPEAQSVREYLTRRELSQELQVRFGIGYAPPGWENLGMHLKQAIDFVRTEPDILSQAGLTNNRDNGQGQYDRFRHRLIIPIFNEKGDCVAFGGRALSDDDKPKYLNSPESPVYHKSEILYGFHLAKDTIRATKRAVVMEGYFDVIAAHSAGVTEAVGSCGTALTDQHLKLLTRFGAETVVLAFDSDEAGLKAAQSAIQLMEPYLESADLRLKVLIIPDGKDPDDFVRSQGANAQAAFAALVANAQDYLSFKFHMALRGLPLDTPDGRIQAANRVTPLLAALNRPTVRAEYLRMTAEQIGISEDSLRLEIQRYEQARNPNRNNVYTFEKNSFDKKAISKKGRTSLQSNQPRLTDNVSQLLGALSTRQTAVEKTWLRLFLYNSDTAAIMCATLKAMPEFTLLDDNHQAILAGLRVVAERIAAEASPGAGNTQATDEADSKIDPSDNNNLGTIIEYMNHQYLDQPPVIQAFADLVLTAESFGDSLNLHELKGSQLREKVIGIAESQVVQLESVRRRQQLSQLRHADTEEIEKQYLMQDALRELHPTENPTG